MLFDPSNLNVTALKELIKKLSDKYSHAIKDDRPLKDVKEIKKAIHYVERKIAEAEEKR
jgi:archaellum component FlaC